jgi:hypothetical protein
VSGAHDPEDAAGSDSMSAIGDRLLRIGGVLNLGVAALHVGIVFFGAPAYRFFGAGEDMASWAEQASPLPAIITLGLALLFAVFGLYAFSAAGALRRLPLIVPVVLGVGVIYGLRGGLGVLAAFFVPDNSTAPVAITVAFSLVALAIGVLYLLGLWMVRQRFSTTPAKREEAHSS